MSERSYEFYQYGGAAFITRELLRGRSWDRLLQATFARALRH